MKIVFILTSLLLTFPIYGQDIGVLYDRKGQEMSKLLEFGNYLKPDIEVSIEEPLKLEKGVISFVSGDTLSGKFRVVSTFKIEQEVGEDEFEEIELSDVVSLKTASDTFLVMNAAERLNIGGGKKSNVVFILIDETENYKVYSCSYDQFTHYVLKNKSSGEWVDTFSIVPENFRKNTLSKFKYIPWVVNRWNSLDRRDMPAIIKMVKYYEAYVGKRKIKLDKDLAEVRGGNKTEYIVEINEVKEDLWSLSFVGTDGLRRLDATYNSLFPMTFHGKVNFYHPNGNLRESGSYEEGKPVGVFSSYHRNGDLKAKFKYSKSRKKRKYISIQNHDEQLRKVTKYDRLLTYDSINQRSITYVLENGHLKASRYADKDLNSYVYLLADNSFNLILAKEIDYPSELSDKEGLVLLKVKVGKANQILDNQVVYFSNEVFRDKVESFFSNKENYSAKTGLYNKERICSEFVVSIRFSVQKNRINGLRSIQAYNFNWLNNHIMLRQPVQINVASPSIPGF